MLYCYETVNGTLNAENCFFLLHKKAKCYLNLPCVYLITQMATVLSLNLAYKHQTMLYHAVQISLSSSKQVKVFKLHTLYHTFSLIGFDIDIGQ